jgi:hypothetical protein
VPFFKARANSSRRRSANGRINGITTLQSGTPFSISTSTDTANTSGQGPNRADVVKTPTWNCGAGHLTACIDITAFAVPALYGYGNSGRNILRGPHQFSTDLSIHKIFPIRERLRFTFRAEAFNVWNNPEFSNPASNVQTPATFGNYHGHFSRCACDPVRWQALVLRESIPASRTI